MSELEQVIGRLDRIEGKVDKALEYQSAHEEAAKARQREIDELRQTVFGNGRQGLKLDVAQMQALCAQRHQAGLAAKVLPVVLATVISTGTLATIGLLLGLWKMH